MEATDPKEKKELWEEAYDEVTNWMNIDADKSGNINDRGALLCRALYNELGVKKFKQLLKDGIIPRDFAVKVSEILTILIDESLSQRDAKRGDGDLADNKGKTYLNHKVYADFLEKYSREEV